MTEPYFMPRLLTGKLRVSIMKFDIYFDSELLGLDQEPSKMFPYD